MRSHTRRAVLGAAAGVGVGFAGCTGLVEESRDIVADDRTTESTPETTTTPEPFDSVDGRWERYMGDLGATGNTDDYGPATDPRTVWRFRASDHVGSPVVADGKVFIGDDADGVVCLDARTGDQEWELRESITNSRFVRSLAVHEDRLYASLNWGDHNTRHYELSFSGDELWQTGNPRSNRTTAVVTDAHLYAVSVVTHDDDDILHAFDRETGEVVWKTEDPLDTDRTDTDVYGPVVHDGLPYVGHDDYVSLVDPTDGSPQWTVEIEDGGYATAFPTAADDALYSAHVRTLVALDAGSGEHLWSADFDSSIRNSVAVDEESVYVVNANGAFALDRETGERLWSYSLEGSQDRSAPVVGVDTVYFGMDQTLHAVTADGGEQRWTIRFDGEIRSAPAVVGNKLFVGAGEELVAVGVE
ncbi:outer membrane protein assembly factor BamB family protein [Halorussus halobius]|uniref:outer membrane protein assembly factor BamB family protein n=1 Tax=Halorussus halobius TaxID=1710537 RepID=UPI00109314F6|nr:PQQ-binding-like beta-propeller repeat protein [Halorussus halobius]